MPAAIGAAILAELGATALVTSAVATTVVGYVAISGALLAVQQVVEALSPAQKRNDAQITVRQAIPPRRRGHGREKLGGAIFFLDTLNGGIARGVVHHAGLISNIREYWLGDVRTTLVGQSGGVVPDSQYQGKVIIQAFKGTDTQPAAGGLLQFPYWTPAARLRGLAYTVVIAEPMKHGDKIFPEGAPDVRLVADLSPCYDPRNPAHNPTDRGTWSWSDNAALTLLEYLHDESGYGIPFDEIDLASFVALANVCDEAVPLRVPAADGATTEPRYRSWGTYTFDEERATVLGRYLSACDAELTQDGEGRVSVTGGRWHPPTFTITEDMILGWEQFEEGSEAYATFNRVKWTYKSPLHDYQPLEGDPWDNPESQAEIGVVPTERDFGRAPSHSQGRRLAKIAERRGAPRFRFTGLRLSPAALPAYGEPTVRLVLPLFGIDTTFAIAKGALTGPLKCEPVLDLYSFGPEAYAWSPIEEGNPPPLPDASSPDPAPIPTGITFEAIRYTSSGAVTALAARFTAPPVAGRADLTLIGRYRPAGAAAWQDMASQDGAAVAGPLNDGVLYERQLAWLATGSIGDWSPTATFSISADITAPAAPTYLTISGPDSAALVSHAGRMPNSANARSLRLMRARGFGKVFADSAAVDSQAGAPNSTLSLSDTIDLGLYLYWLQALNGSGVASPESASKSAFRYMQPGNLLTAPYDFTNAAWAKAGVTAASTAAGPDGNGASLLSEQTNTGGHLVDQTVSITAGSKLRLAIGLKASGRTKATLYLFNTGSTARAQVAVDLATGTVSGLQTIGTGVTAISADIVRVSADYYLVMLTATVATSTAIVRVRFADDTGSLSYTGDTTKGMALWSASLAVVP